MSTIILKFLFFNSLYIYLISTSTFVLFFYMVLNQVIPFDNKGQLKEAFNIRYTPELTSMNLLYGNLEFLNHYMCLYLAGSRSFKFWTSNFSMVARSLQLLYFTRCKIVALLNLAHYCMHILPFSLFYWAFCLDILTNILLILIIVLYGSFPVCIIYIWLLQ